MTAVQPVRRRQGSLILETSFHSEPRQTHLLQNGSSPNVGAANVRHVRHSIPQPSIEPDPDSAALPPLDVGKIGGTDRRTADRLRRGRVAIDMRLDLHGLTLEIAHHRLLAFLVAAQASDARCVLVITGKGTRSDGGIGRLRAAVPRWLNESMFRPLVLSVTHARPKDGGAGALYILLRKSRSDQP
jgi:DNA-nicking Smr family endonuclease